MPLGTLPYKAQPISHVWSEDSSLLTVTFDVFDSSTPQVMQTSLDIGIYVNMQEDWPLVISRLQKQNQLLQIQQAVASTSGSRPASSKECRSRYETRLGPSTRIAG